MTLSTRVRFLLVSCACAAMFAMVAGTARAQCDAPSPCMPPSICPYWGTTPVVSYPGGSKIRINRLHDPTTCAVPAPGATINSFFDIFVELSFIPPSGPSSGCDALTDGLMIIRYMSSDLAGDHYDTELLGLHISSSTLPPGVMIRESPTRQSLGKTTIKPVGGGIYHIDSFFDVFTELSLDGGQTWVPSDQPSHHTAARDLATPARVSTWGSVKILYR